MGARQLVVSSAYFSHDDDIMPPPRIARELVRYCKDKNRDFIIGCDANAHHELWASIDTNSRGESLMEYFLENQLVVHNRGKGHTFETRTRREVLDLTFSNLTSKITISDWKVSKEMSYSDHKYIEFKLGTGYRKSADEGAGGYIGTNSGTIW
ncbi:uncharacterized protein LOC142224740 [Haematobia irritans]|uniref:uncharacterized protein LOC142224740 n=1 Tax=Haematobia irritans TaxID=7368 RepID=UPI003F500AEB